MGFFSKIFSKKNDEYSPKFRLKMAEYLDKRYIKYAVERGEDSTETVLGKDGCIYVKDDLLRVVAGQGIVFEGKIVDLLMSELLSKEGVVIEGYDFIQGKERKIIAYFTHYSKNHKGT